MGRTTAHQNIPHSSQSSQSSPYTYAMASIRTLFRLATTVASANRAFSTTARNNYAKLAVIGRLAGAPEAHASSTGRTYVKYSLATSHGSRDNERTSWWNVTSFPSSDAQKDYLLGLPKGALVHLEEDADSDKVSRRSLNLVQRNLEVLGRPNSAQAAPEADEPLAASA